MAEQNIVKDVDTVYVKPSGDGENVEDPDKKDDETVDDQKGADESSDADSNKKDELIDHSQPAVASDQKPEGGDGSNKVVTKEVDGETPRERALREELTIARGKLRQEKGQELGIQNAPIQTQPNEQPKTQEVLKKYKPEEIAALREVLPALADEMGYVKSQDLSQQTYSQQAQAVLDDFLEAHPEYAAENDKDGVLWNAFKTEYGLYNKPANPKDFTKIFNRIHTAIFGIKPTGSNGAINAAREKINVASHAGASGPTRSNAPAQKSGASAGLRLDMLKGFDDEDISDIERRAAG